LTSVVAPFLWSATDSIARGKCEVVWPVVAAPKCYGGLGVPDIRILKSMLRLRWESQKSAPDVTP